MKVQITRESIKLAAERLLSNLPTLKRSQAYEALAKAFGHPNWDTLSGMLNRQVEPKVRVERPLTLFVEAFSTSEYDPGPNWAQVSVDQKFVDEVLRLQALCRDHGVNLVRTDWAPDAWQEDEDDCLNIRDDDLCVGPNRWWFRALPKHCNYAVETRSIDIDEMVAVLTGVGLASSFLQVGSCLFFSASGSPAQFREELIETGVLPEQDD